MRDGCHTSRPAPSFPRAYPVLSSDCRMKASFGFDFPDPNVARQELEGGDTLSLQPRGRGRLRAEIVHLREAGTEEAALVPRY